MRLPLTIASSVLYVPVTVIADCLMKLAKFIYPMFLVAIGLHGLLLFVPVGGASESAPKDNDDIALGELPTASNSSISPEDRSLETLPAANPNVDSGPVVSPRQPAVVVPPMTAPNRQPAVVTARSAAQPSAVGRSAAGQIATAANTATKTATSTVAPHVSLSPVETPPAVSIPGSPPSGVPSTSAPANTSRLNPMPGTKGPEVSAANSATTATTGAERQSVSAVDLIASAQGTVSQALKSLQRNFATEFTYAAKDTDNASADSRRADWIALINRQVNAAAVSETIAPTPIAEPVQLSYPVETSKQTDRRSFQVCLDPEPQTAEVGIVFDSQGNLVGEPEIIRSTGYLALNNEILAIAAEAEAVPDNRQSKAYTLEFEIDYVAERCTSLEKLAQSAGSSS